MEHYRLISKTDISTFWTGFLLFIKNGLRFIVVSVRKRIAIALLVFLAVIAGGFYYQHIREPYYETDMACAYNNMHQKIYGEMVQKLENLAKSKSYNELSSVLGLTVAEAGTIKRFTPKNAVGSALYEDFTDNASLINRFPFYIEVRATDRNIYPKLQTGLLNYLNGTPYRATRTKLESQIRNEKIWYLDRNITQIDSVISSYASYLKHMRGSADTISGFSNITTLLALKSDLEDKKLDKEYNNTLVQSVELIHGFTPADHPNTLGILFYSLLFLAAAVIACICSVLVNVLYDRV
jgi:hypothetical protein